MTLTWKNEDLTAAVEQFSSEVTQNYSTVTQHPIAVNEPDFYYYPYNRNVELYYGVEILVTVCAPILMVTGTVANVITLVTATKSAELRECPVNVYILFLTSVDTILLDLGLLDHILYVQGTEIRILSSGACRAVLCILGFLRMWDAWILVNMCVEGLAFVFVPYWGIRLFDRSKITIGVFLSAVASFAISLVNAGTMQAHQIVGTEQKICSPMQKHFTFYNSWFWVDWSLTLGVPTVAMATFVITIVIRIIYVTINKKKLQVTQNIKLSSLTYTFLAMSVVYTILSTPLAVLQALIFHRSSEPVGQISHLFNAFIVLDFLWYLNCASRFFVYMACYRKFRREVKTMTMWVCKKRSGKLASSRGGVAANTTGVRLSVYKKDKTVINETNGSLSTVA